MSLSKSQNFIAHPILATQNMEMGQRQPYHIITNPVIRTECDSAIPDTCKQGPRVRTRPQTRKTRKRGHQHMPNFRGTRSGQKSGALHQLISQETSLFQSLQMPFASTHDLFTKSCLRPTETFAGGGSKQAPKGSVQPSATGGPGTDCRSQNSTRGPKF